MPSAVVSRMAPSSSALAWPTGDGPATGTVPGTGTASAIAAAMAAPSLPRSREDQRQRGFVVPGNRIEARVGGRCLAPIVRGLACGNRHRRAGVRRAGGARDAGLDIERIETAGVLQRMQAGIAHPLPGTRGWHRAAGRADRSARRRAADRAAPCRVWLRRAAAVRVRSAIQVFRLRGCSSASASPAGSCASERLGDHVGDRMGLQARAGRSRFRAAPTIAARVR